MRKIVLGITGSIAAYKSIYLVRLLKKANFEVRVVMTASSCEFVTPLTFQTLTGNRVVSDLIDAEHHQGMGHIELAKWADIVVLAPCSANTLSKLAMGMADNLLTSLVLATDKPILIAPGMNQQMWHNRIIQDNVNKLKTIGIDFVGPEIGEQACGDFGAGRMETPEKIMSQINVVLGRDGAFKGKTVLITAGPTVEPIDPVRYISNHSSGKMADALCRVFKYDGARVIVIKGATELLYLDADIVESVGSADEMLGLCELYAKEADIFIGAAAVCDFKVQEIASQKIKKKQDQKSYNLELIKNNDVLKTISEKYPHLIKVGFAAETEHFIANGVKKLVSKGLDFICINDVSNNQVFGKDNNRLIILDKNQNKFIVDEQNKFFIATEIKKILSKTIYLYQKNK